MPATLRTNLAEIARALRPKVDEAIEDSVEDVARSARALVPVESGLLKSAIHTEKRGMAEWAVVAGGKTPLGDAFYGHLVEYGSSVGGRDRPPQPPHPFLVPALEAHRAIIRLRVEGGVEGRGGSWLDPLPS